MLTISQIAINVKAVFAFGVQDLVVSALGYTKQIYNYRAVGEKYSNTVNVCEVPEGKVMRYAHNHMYCKISSGTPIPDKEGLFMGVVVPRFWVETVMWINGRELVETQQELKEQDKHYSAQFTKDNK